MAVAAIPGKEKQMRIAKQLSRPERNWYRLPASRVGMERCLPEWLNRVHRFYVIKPGCDYDRLCRNVDQFASLLPRKILSMHSLSTSYSQPESRSQHPLMTPICTFLQQSWPAVESTKRRHHEIGLKFGQIDAGARDLPDG